MLPYVERAVRTGDGVMKDGVMKDGWGERAGAFGRYVTSEIARGVPASILGRGGRSAEVVTGDWL